MSDMNIPEEQAVEADLPVRGPDDESTSDEVEAVENTAASEMPPG